MGSPTRSIRPLIPQGLGANSGGASNDDFDQEELSSSGKEDTVRAPCSIVTTLTIIPFMHAPTASRAIHTCGWRR